MCGIAGIFGQSFDETKFKESLTRQGHRGPDYTDTFDFRYGIMGHNRLSIIDLSSDSNQPMVSACGNYVLVFNGEIYNYKDLAAKYGVTDTRSDTKVLLELLVSIGIDILPELSGMFSFALHNSLSNELIISRDSLGMKPLHYMINSDNFIFASEISVIADYFPRQINADWLEDFIVAGNTINTSTVYQDVLKVPTDVYMKYDYESAKLIEIKKIEKASHKLMSVEEIIAQHSLADVKIGVSLSGGIDSSSIVGCLSNISGLKAITLKSQKNIDDVNRSINFTQKIGIDHEIIEMEEFSTAEIISLIELMDYPLGEGGELGIAALCKAFKSHNIKVMLLGDGGDEVFGGYSRYQLAYLMVLPKFLRRTLSFFVFNTKIKELLRTDSIDSFYLRASINGSNIICEKRYTDLLERIRKRRIKYQIPDVITPNNLMALDRRILWPDIYIPKVELISMLYSIEARTPFISNEMIAGYDGLSSYHKVGFVTKKPLRSLFKSLYGEAYSSRKKEGLNIPLESYGESLHGIVRDFRMIKHYLPSLDVENVINLSVFVRWRLIVAEVWLRSHVS